MPAIPKHECGNDEYEQSGLSAADARRDVDFLVNEIKENLKLSHFYPNTAPGGGKLRSSRSVPSHLACHRAKNRNSPYAVPPCSRVAGIDNSESGNANDGIEKGPSQLKRWNQRRRYPSTCLPSGGQDPDDPFQMLKELITDGSLIKEAVRRLNLGLTPKYSTRSFYDSDEECRTPPAYPELCCEI